MATELHRWYMEHGSSTIVDQVGSDDGTVVGSPTESIGPVDGAAIYFSANQYVSCGNISDIDFGSNDFTIRSVFRRSRTSRTYNKNVLGKNAGTGVGQRSFNLRTGASSYELTFIGFFDSGTSYQLDSPFEICDGLYHDVFIVRDGDYLYMYVDGALVDSVALAASAVLDTSTANFTIGNIQIDYSQYDLKGDVDHVQIWSGALTATEISDMYFEALTTTMSLTNQDPAPSSTNQAIDGSIDFSIEDSTNNVVLGSVAVKVNGQYAYYGSSFQTGFGGSVTSDGSGGYDFAITHDADFAENSTVTIQVVAYNDVSEILNQVYTFDTAIYPFLSATDPSDGDTGVPVNENVTFRIDAGSIGSIDLSSVFVTIGGTVAFNGAAAIKWKNDYTGTYTVDGNGYIFDIDPPDDFETDTIIAVHIEAANNLSYGNVFDYSFRSNIYEVYINPVSPVAGERLIPIDSHILIDFPAELPTLVVVNGVTIYNGTQQNGWTVTFVSHANGDRMVADGPTDFTIGDSQLVEVTTPSAYLEYRFAPGVEKITTENDAATPIIHDADGNVWIGYTRDDEQSLPPGFYQGNIYLRKGYPLTSEVRAVLGEILDIGYDEAADLLYFVFEHNGKLQFMTADPTDTPSYKDAVSVLNTVAVVNVYGPVGLDNPGRNITSLITYPPIKKLFADSAKIDVYGPIGLDNPGRNIPSLESFPPIKRAFTDYVVADIYGSVGLDGPGRNAYYIYGSPTLEVVKVPPDDEVTIHVYPDNVDDSVSDLIIGFEVYKRVKYGTFWRYLGYTAYTQGDLYSIFVDQHYTRGAVYCAKAVFQRGQYPTWTSDHGSANDMPTHTEEIKVEPYGASYTYTLDITGFDPIGVG